MQLSSVYSRPTGSAPHLQKSFTGLALEAVPRPFHSAGSCWHQIKLSGRNWPKLYTAIQARGQGTMETARTAQQVQLPKTYRRLVAHRTGHSFRDVAVLEEAQLQAPGPGQVVIKVTYAGINGGCETFRARGEFAFAGNKSVDSFLLGAEGAGIIAAVGPDVDNLKVGQHVTFVGGAFGEYVTAKAATCWPVQQALPEAVALTISGVTAAAALEVTSPVQAGEIVMVTAAAGGTGHFGVQLAKLAGAHVVATCGGPHKAEVLRDLGADRVIDYKSEDVADVLEQEYPQCIDLAYEGVGGQLRQTVLDNLTPQGRMLCVGYISEYPHTDAAAGAASTSGNLPPAEELFWQQRTVQRGEQTIFGNVWPKDRAAMLQAKQRLFDRYYGGEIKALIDKSQQFKGIDSVVDAIEYMLSGVTIGKVVVEM
ncbi:hypothetical protein WJX72_011155 [[Myrmecia] bisecta]|uniref:Enoyl reductase (ER) domain-containing protein n=1 Tax=[Myrmecia] bisecta TaxID=41462 RepID=A0AAW1PPR7_9CHLO